MTPTARGRAPPSRARVPRRLPGSSRCPVVETATAPAAEGVEVAADRHLRVQTSTSLLALLPALVLFDEPIDALLLVLREGVARRCLGLGERALVRLPLRGRRALSHGQAYAAGPDSPAACRLPGSSPSQARRTARRSPAPACPSRSARQAPRRADRSAAARPEYQPLCRPPGPRGGRGARGLTGVSPRLISSIGGAGNGDTSIGSGAPESLGALGESAGGSLGGGGGEDGSSIALLASRRIVLLDRLY